MNPKKTEITISVKIPNLKKETIRWWGIIKNSKDLSVALHYLYVQMVDTLGDRMDESKQDTD